MTIQRVRNAQGKIMKAKLMLSNPDMGGTNYAGAIQLLKEASKELALFVSDMDGKAIVEKTESPYERAEQ